MLSGEAAALPRPVYDPVRTSDPEAMPLAVEKRKGSGAGLGRGSGLIAAVEALHRREPPPFASHELGGSPSRSRSAQRSLPASALGHSVQRLMHAKSLRGLARRSGSRAMISNSYRILDQKRVSHDGGHSAFRRASGPGLDPYGAHEGPTIAVPPGGADRRARAPVSVSLHLLDGRPQSKFCTMPDAGEGPATGELISLQFGRPDQSKSPRTTILNSTTVYREARRQPGRTEGPAGRRSGQERPRRCAPVDPAHCRGQIPSPEPR